MSIQRGYMPKAQSTEWETPQNLYDELNKEFYFHLDVCATHKNHKCKSYWTKEENAITKYWFGTVFCNPPHDMIEVFLLKGLYERESNRTQLLVYLLPARTGTKWFHNLVLGKAEIRFLKGRLRFKNDKGYSVAAPFDSMIAIFRKQGFCGQAKEGVKGF